MPPSLSSPAKLGTEADQILVSIKPLASVVMTSSLSGSANSGGLLETLSNVNFKYAKAKDRNHRLNMELDLQSSCVQLYSMAETPQLPPSSRIWAHIQGRYWSAKMDHISL
jgi:hypothetical protein